MSFDFPRFTRQRFTIKFQRTLRIPDDGRDYPLPPGLGAFPLRHLDDYAARLPESWRERGGVIAPMHQAEALWISFSSGYPFAVKVATGKVCAITGDDWAERLNRDPQDYMVLPDQPWLDGYCVEKGAIRQFVAMPLGEGYTVEEQLTGAAVHGGMQLIAYPMKLAHYEALRAKRSRSRRAHPGVLYDPGPPGMGLAPGGRMKQDIYDDPHGLDAWDQRNSSRCFVSLLNTAQWMAVTGERPPDRAAHRPSLLRARPALVRLLRRRLASGRRQRKTARASQRLPTRPSNGKGASAKQRVHRQPPRRRARQAPPGSGRQVMERLNQRCCDGPIEAEPLRAIPPPRIRRRPVPNPGTPAR